MDLLSEEFYKISINLWLFIKNFRLKISKIFFTISLFSEKEESGTLHLD